MIKIENIENLRTNYDSIVKEEYKIENIKLEVLIDEIKNHFYVNDYVNNELTWFEVSGNETKTGHAELIPVTYDSGFEYSGENGELIQVREEKLIF